MKYIINDRTEKEWNGKKFVEAHIEDVNGGVYQVSAWNGEFDGKSEIDVELEKNDKGYWRIKAQPKPRSGAPSAFKSQQIEKAQERKEASVNRVLDRKEESIKLMAAQRDAVLITTEQMKSAPFPNEDEIKAKIIAWRNWFLNDFNKDIPPF